MKYIFILASLLLSFISFGQSVGVGTTTPHPSAALDITSSDAGLLIPRVDTSAISSPATGLMIFQPTDNGFYFYTGLNWQKLGTVSEISDQDGDTHIRTEQTPDEDAIRFTAGGTETLIIKEGRLDMPDAMTNVIVGHDAGANQTGEYNVIIGEEAGMENEADQNVIVGHDAGRSNTTGLQNVIIGDQAGYSNTTGYSNTFMGKDAGFHNTEGIGNIAIGFTAGRQNETGYNKLFIGNSAGYNNVNAFGAVMIGHSAGLDNNSVGNTFVGNFSNQFGNLTNSISIGEYTARESESGQLIAIGNSAAYNLEGYNNIAIGYQSGLDANGSNNIFLGRQSGNVTKNSDNVFIGDKAGLFNGNGYRSVHIGTDVGKFDTASINNVYIGYKAGEGGPSISSFHTKSSNVLIGERTGHLNKGSDNTMIGARAGEVSDGEGNIFIGRNAGRVAVGDNKLFIDNTDTNSPLIYGNLASDSVVINGTLNLNQEYTFPSNDGLTNQVMSTDGNGQLTWKDAEDEDWTLSAFGFYNDTERIAIGTSEIPINNKLTVRSNDARIAGHFSNYNITDNSYGIASYNYGLATSTKYGVFGFASAGGAGTKFGVSGIAYGNSSGVGYGGFFQGYNSNSIGIYAKGEKLAARFDGIVGIGTSEGFDSQVHIHKASNLALPSKIRFTDYITGLGSSTTDEGLEIGLGTNQQGVFLHHGNENLEFYLNTTDKVLTLEPDGDMQMGIAGENDRFQLNLGSVQLYNLGASDDNNGYKWAEDGNDAFGFVYDGAGTGSSNRLHLREYLGTDSDILTIKGDGRVGFKNVVPGFDIHMGNNSAAKPASSAWSVTSDARSKDVLGNFEDGLETVLNINPVNYRYNGRYNLPDGLEAIGAVAQDLMEVAPYMVNTSRFENENGENEEYYTVDYGAMDFVLINAIKDLKEIIDTQQKKIEALEAEVSKIK